MKIAWISTHYTEAERDIALCSRPGLEIILCSCTPPITAQERELFKVHAKEDTTWSRHEFVLDLHALQADLYVFRYPYWLDDSFVSIPQPAVAWASEQGPTKHWIVACSRRHFEHVAYNARIEEAYYRKELPDKVLHYLPYGCTHHAPCDSESRYCSDIVVDGSCHYACRGAGCCEPSMDDKHQSVSTMLLPLLNGEFDLKAWGPGDPPHGWLGIPQIRDSGDRYYAGYYLPADYARVYSSCKLYLGITWNWRLGGFGTKLARALSTGIPVLWHRTLGMAQDGLVSGEHLLVSSSPEETLETTRRLLANDRERITIGRAGRQFALRNWEWGNNLLRLAEEIL